MAAAEAAFDDDALYVVIMTWPIFLLLVGVIGVVIGIYKLGKMFGGWILRVWRKLKNEKI